MVLTKLAIKAAVPLPQVEAFQRYLFVGPHPDDIEIGAGATAAKLVKQGKDVTFLICMDGRFGDGFVSKDVTREQLIALRREECIASAAVLGVKDVRFLDLCDGGFYDCNDLLKGIAKTAADVQAEMIFGPDHFVASESHPDHLNTGKAVGTIAFSAPYPGIMEQYGTICAPVQAVGYYMTAHPNRYVKTSGLMDRQLKALACHISQYPEGSTEYGSIRTYLKVRSIEFGLKSFKGQAEGFRVLGITHMHCLPEAGQ